MMQFGSPSAEHRLIRFMREIGSNAKTWGHDTKVTYVDQGIEENNPVKIALAAPALIASAAFELPDYLYAGIVDDQLAPPDGSAFSRTRRDISGIIKNNVRHPLRTVLTVIRTPGSLAFDGFDLLGGYEHTGNSHFTRAQMQELFTQTSTADVDAPKVVRPSSASTQKSDPSFVTVA